MQRLEMIKRVGEKYLTSNIENNEFSYAQELPNVNKGHFKLDIRFYDSQSKIAVLIETKGRFSIKDYAQLFAYVNLEQQISKETKIIAILANTKNDKIKVWKVVDNTQEELDDTEIKSFQEYIGYFKPKNVNDKTAVLVNTSILNKSLHDNGIPEKLRSQFVGTCLLALKNGLVYKGLSTEQIIAGIKSVLSSLLKDDIERAKKLVILEQNVLESQSVSEIEPEHFRKLLSFIEDNILPYINEESNEGQDILSYFFTTFNKYVAREDKNQAFTPNHLAHFMCKVAKIFKTSVVLDPTCGSGTFLVQAMSMALQLCETDDERAKIKKEQIYGIEYDENVYGLATTNMLIHGDGNSNIKCNSCFDVGKWIDASNANIVLMNPPYNASKNQVPKEFAKRYGKSSTDPSKGLYFVHYVAEHVKHGRLITLLPMACAIQTDGIIGEYKAKMLKKHTLDAVFSFPSEMFYPGASVVACCMVFNLGQPHPTKDFETFFGYFKDDGFEKRKGIGRVDVSNKWVDIEKKWLYLYEHRLDNAGMSITKQVSAESEWCAEAYMETDYSQITDEDFANKTQDYAAFLIRNASLKDAGLGVVDTSKWKWFKYDSLFTIKKGKRLTKADMEDGTIRYIGAIDSNNGISNHISNSEHIHSANTITVSYNGSIAEAYYQNERFWATDDVNVLYPKFQLNKYIALFLTTLINKEKYRFNYGRKWDKELMNSSQIKLPVKGKDPDWKWIEEYIKETLMNKLPITTKEVFEKDDITDVERENQRLEEEKKQQVEDKKPTTKTKKKTQTNKRKRQTKAKEKTD